MGGCPTGGQANNIVRYDDFDTGGMCAKPSESGGDVPDPVLDEKHGVGVKDPPDLEGDIVYISDLRATVDEDPVHIATDTCAAILTVFPGPVRQPSVRQPSVRQLVSHLSCSGQRNPAGDLCSRVPADDRGDVQDLVVDPHTVVASSEHIAAKDFHDRHAALSLVLVHDSGDPYPTHVSTGVVPGNVEQGDAQLDVCGGGDCQSQGSSP